MSEVRCPILQMQMNQVSLENIFLELTEDSDKRKRNRRENPFLKRNEKDFWKKRIRRGRDSGKGG